VFYRLSDEHAIKGVTVMEWERTQSSRRQQRKIQPFKP
jgi:hypothetical protein